MLKYEWIMTGQWTISRDLTFMQPLENEKQKKLSMKTGAVPHEGQTGAWCWVRGSYNTLVVSSPAVSPAHWHVTSALTAGSMSSQCQKLAWLTPLLVLPRLTPSRHKPHLMIPITHRHRRVQRPFPSVSWLVSQSPSSFASVSFLPCIISANHGNRSNCPNCLSITLSILTRQICSSHQTVAQRLLFSDVKMLRNQPFAFEWNLK